MNVKAKHIAVLGSGAWGTALAISQCMIEYDVWLYGRDQDLFQEMQQTRQNKRYLPDITLPDSLNVSTDLAQVVTGADAILVAIPAQNMRLFLQDLLPIIPENCPLILCAKGIEKTTGNFMSEIVQQQRKNQSFAILSGPSFAEDVARGLPTAVTVASYDMILASKLIDLLSSQRLRCYASSDVRGVEIGGSLKNVLAIAAGAVHGAKLGASAQAALITRGFAELLRLGSVWGGKVETLRGLSGLGDLILTASSAQSRNFTYGIALAQEKDLSHFKLAEGVATAKIAAQLCREQKIDAPIIEATANLLDQKLTVHQAMESLLMRPLKYED